MSNKSIHIKPAPYYRKSSRSLSSKITLAAAALLIWATVITGGVLVN